MGATLLRVNLSNGKTGKEPIAEALVRQFIGGRGVATKLLADAGADPGIDPFDPANPLLFATGPLTGTFAPTGGRYMVVTKSPLTGAVACSNSGGYWGPALRYGGYDYLMIEGAAREPVYLWIKDDSIQIRSAKHLWGKWVAETEDAVRNETHPEARVACIGPAGENRARVACVMNDKGRAAGRSGVGAVMGAKNLKAVAVYGSKGLRVPNPQEFLHIARIAVDAVAKSAAESNLTLLGTAEMVDAMNEIGMLPTYNFQKGIFVNAGAVNGERVRSDFMTRNRGCHSCTIACGRVTKITGHGPLDGRGEGPEYETIFGLGSDCGVGDLAAITKANYLCNELGMDTIEAGATIATAMELAQRGYLPEADIGFPLKFGDAEPLLALTEAMGCRKGFGEALAEGGYRVAAKYGHPDLFMGSKKQAFAAYDPRGSVGMGLGYATSNRGACHLRGFMASLERLGDPVQLDPFTPKEKGMHLSILQNSTAFADASGLCLFSTTMMGDQMVADLVGHVLDMKIDERDVQRIGERIWNLERLYNNRAGLTRKDDSLPPRMLEEPLTEGAARGHVVPLEEMLDDYYQCRGWDHEGRPTPQKLAELGLA